MKELAKHIEALLLDNDCVILPNFGGFITNYVSARWVEEENVFLPPYRTIGFNPQLKINDGLLVQSYMQSHDATFPEALKMVERAIDALSEFLYKEGVVELRGIGCLYRTYAGEFHFEPTEDGVLTPTLYGLSSVVAMPVEQLVAHRKEREKMERESATVAPALMTEKVDEKQRHATITIRLRREWVANIAATAAAIAMFFLLSIPVDNTYIEEENYASLGDVNSIFDQVASESVLTTLFEIPVEKLPEAARKPMAVTVSEADARPSTTESANAEPLKVTPESVLPIGDSNPVVADAPKTKVEPAVPVEASAPVVTESPKAETKPMENKPVMVETTKTVMPKFNIIVASVTSESDAETAINDFAEKGYPGAFLIKGGGRFRIALKAFDSESEAYRMVSELKKDELFKHAWVLKAKR